MNVPCCAAALRAPRRRALPPPSASASAGPRPRASRAPDDAREHVAGARGREPRAPPSRRRGAAAPGVAIERVRALQKHGAARLGCRAPDVLEPGRRDLVALDTEQARELARVRRERGRPRPAAERREAAAQRVQRVGIEHERRLRTARPAGRRDASPSSSRPRPGPSTTASARPASASTSSGSRVPCTISSAPPTATCSRTSGETATKTTPAPARNAARAASSGAPLVPGAPPTTSTAPASYFEPSGSRRGSEREVGRIDAKRVRGAARTARGRPIGDRHDIARVRASGLDRRPELASVEGDRAGGVDRDAGDLAGASRRCRSGCRARAPALRAARCGRSPRRSPARGDTRAPVPSRRVDHDVGAGEIVPSRHPERVGDAQHRRGVAARRDRRWRDEDDPDVETRIPQVPCDDEAVTAVVARAADDGDAAGGGEARAQHCTAAAAPAASISAHPGKPASSTVRRSSSRRSSARHSVSTAPDRTGHVTMRGRGQRLRPPPHRRARLRPARRERDARRRSKRSRRPASRSCARRTAASSCTRPTT